MQVRDACERDVPAIHAVLASNAADTSLFQQSAAQIARAWGEFVVAEDGGAIVGCAEVHWHASTTAEILAVAVAAGAHRRGTGSALVAACIARARGRGATLIWLATAKPAYFARFGFQPMSRLRLPTGVLVTKLRLVFGQRAARWLPALFGRHTIMRLTG